MRLSDIQPKKNFSYIFVQFPGMKMNVPMLSSSEGRAVKEDVALCVQLNKRDKVHQLYFVRTQSIKPFDFTDEGIGAKALYRVIKQKEDSHNSNNLEVDDFVTVITDEVKIVQKKTNSGYNFILVLNEREIGIVASIEQEIHTEKSTLQHIEKAQPESSSIIEGKENKAGFRRRSKKTIQSGGYAFQDMVVMEPIRILLEDVKRKVKVFSPAALDFIGPGD
ncbi:hypothetical protein [Neobacillus cucumis]|uniref:hypothetical protein n=1 Tax=Neobacillus cucumis TaxID=1740721 RepID=UPI002852FAF3|nr:hypothetical protein [Neobacillus cucumis]MDR4946669.1 hypothetical protein [Neobacillus cucumis]